MKMESSCIQLRSYALLRDYARVITAGGIICTTCDVGAGESDTWSTRRVNALADTRHLQASSTAHRAQRE